MREQELERQLAAANSRIRELEGWKESASHLLAQIDAARDTGITDARYLGKGTPEIIRDFVARMKAAEVKPGTPKRTTRKPRTPAS